MTLLSVPTSSRRALASVGDLGVIACWIGVLSLVSLAVRSALPVDTIDVSSVALPAIDLGAFAITVLPVGCYLVATEAGPRGASLGKRWQGLRVAGATGTAPGRRRVLVRTAVKLLPWQLAHLSVSRFITGADLSPMIWVAYGASFVLVVGTVVMALRDPAGRALHDRVAGTRVVVRAVGHAAATA